MRLWPRKKTTWSVEGFVLFNPKFNIYIDLQDGVAFTTYNLMNAYLFPTATEARYYIPNNPEDLQTVKEDWEVRAAEKTVTHS